MKFHLIDRFRRKKNKVGNGDAGDNTGTGSQKSAKKSRIGTVGSLRNILTGRKSKKKDAEHGEDEQGKDDKGPPSNFPCCFYIPLDIAMEGFALLDIIYYSCYALSWGIFLALEPFAGKDENFILEGLSNGTNSHASGRTHVQLRVLGLGEEALRELLARSKSHANSRSLAHGLDDELLDFGDFKETSTTYAPLEHHSVDKMNEARVYSRIARLFKEYGQEVDDGCGRDYFAGFLYANQLYITRSLFEEVARKIIAASLLYAIIGCALLTTVCCFRGYIASKVLVIMLWYLQLVPHYIVLRAAVMSQSHRLCILQYGIGKTTRGQKIMFWSLVWPLLTYKPYEAFIWANYIRRYFKNKDGKLLDESYFSTSKLEERQHKQFSTLSPFSLTTDDFQHHRRPVGRLKLFRHGLKRDYDLMDAVEKTPKKVSVTESAKQNYSSSN